MAVMRTMKRELGTTMIPQKATQVSCDPSIYCMGRHYVGKNVGMIKTISPFCFMEFLLNNSRWALPVVTVCCP
jgi:hypothetical protein